MFTGIIEEIGSIDEVRRIGGGMQLTVKAPKSSLGIHVNASISINGVCQTIIRRDGDQITVVAVEETLLKTSLGSLKVRDRVNLELPLKLGDRIGGHLVSGHVDCVGEIESVDERETSWFFRIKLPAQFKRHVIAMGSIAVDGVSLTIASVEGNTIGISIIPHTMENTIFASYKPSTQVNLEFDMIGKYIQRFAETKNSVNEEDTISREQLRNWGFDL